MNYFKWFETFAFWGPKKLLSSFHIFFLDFLILFLFADNSQIGISWPAFFPKFRLRYRPATGHVPLVGHSHLILTVSSLTHFSSKIPHLSGTPIPPSIQRRNLVVNLDFSLSCMPHTQLILKY